MNKDSLMKKYFRRRRLFPFLLLTQLCLFMLAGCWTRIGRYYNDRNDLGNLHEWSFSTSLTAFAMENKKTFTKEFGRRPEEYYDYRLVVTFWTITEIDTTLSEEERHEARIDSVKLAYKNFEKIFPVENTFADNVRKKTPPFFNYLDAYTKIYIDSFTIPPGTADEAEVTVYGVFKSPQDGLEPFELSTRMKHKETSERLLDLLD